jgi:hypothetical protein
LILPGEGAVRGEGHGNEGMGKGLLAQSHGINPPLFGRRVYLKIRKLSVMDNILSYEKNCHIGRNGHFHPCVGGHVLVEY